MPQISSGANLDRYHRIKILDAGVYCLLECNGLNRPPKGTQMRKLHTKLDQKQVPGHHIYVDVKFLYLKEKLEKKCVDFSILRLMTRSGFARSRSLINTCRPTPSIALTTSSRTFRSAFEKSGLVLSRFSSGLFRAIFAMKEIWNGKEIHRRVSP